MGRIGLSVLLGFLIGLERQITGHPAGIRINVLISMGACLFLMFPLMSGSDEVYRIASYLSLIHISMTVPPNSFASCIPEMVMGAIIAERRA